LSGNRRGRDGLGRLLGLIQTYNGWFTLALTLLIVVGANVLVTSVLHAHLSIGTELGLEILIVLVGVSVPLGLTLFTLWPELRAIFDIVSDGPPKATPILLRFVREEMRSLGDRIADTRSEGVDLEGSIVTPWVRDRCFAVASGPYLGTDSLVPSAFLGTYFAYLREQADYIARTGCATSVRINLASMGALRMDAERNPKAVRRYIAWHRENGVKLLHLDEERAMETARQTGLGERIDLAIWEGQMALLVAYSASGAANLRLALVGETSYRRSMAFFAEAAAEAVPFSSLRLTQEVLPQ
jgi:hypothetical protein